MFLLFFIGAVAWYVYAIIHGQILKEHDKRVPAPTIEELVAKGIRIVQSDKSSET